MSKPWFNMEKNPEQILTKYLEWADNYSENQITIYMILCGIAQGKWQKRLQMELKM